MSDGPADPPPPPGGRDPDDGAPHPGGSGAPGPAGVLFLFAANVARGWVRLVAGSGLAPAGELTARIMEGGGTWLSAPLRHLGRRLPPPPSAVPPGYRGLRVLQPVLSGTTQTLHRMGVRFAIVLLVTVGVLMAPRPEGLGPEGQRALALFAFTGTILALQPVSLPIAALMVAMAQVVLSLGTAQQAFEPFSRPVVFLILASLFLAEALRAHKITRRLALLTIIASGGGIRRLLLGLMGVSAVLSMWVENTATAAVLIPVALTISKQVRNPEHARGLLVLLLLGLTYSGDLGGMVTIMGSASNAVASGFLAQIRPWSFVDWMRYGLPAFVLIFPLTWWLLVRLVPVAVTRLDVEPAREEVRKLGPMTGTDREVVGTMAVAVFFWVGGHFLEPALGLPPTLLSAAMVAVGAVAYLAVRQILHWEDVKGVSWGIFFIIGAGLSLGEALNRSGATDWFAALIRPVVSGPPLLVSMLILVYLSALLTNVMNNTTISAVFVPILISIARSDPAFNAAQLVLPVTLATTFGYSLPSASGRMALVAATGIVKPGEMMRYGLIMTLASAGVLALFFWAVARLGWI